MKEYEIVIGLEVHIELATNSKIFCSCSAKFGGEQNEHVCPACCGMPGTKPHIDILFVCVDKEYQGKGYARHLVEVAKKYAEEESVPLLFDTDMERYAQIYQHYGCELYN